MGFGNFESAGDLKVDRVMQVSFLF